MGWTWHNYEEVWRRKRSSTDFKRLWRDCDLVKDNDGSFNIYWAPRVYNGYDKTTSKNTFKKLERMPLAHITSDNVLTLLLIPELCDQSSMRRLSHAVGSIVFKDSSHNRTRVHKIRISGQIGWGKGVFPWCPSLEGGTFSEKSIPYAVGTQFRLDSADGRPVELLKSEPDTKLRVKNDAVQKAKADTKVIGILLRSMIRIGSFDEYINPSLSRGWANIPPEMKPVNYLEPTGDDAFNLFLLGYGKTQTPPQSMYKNNTWTKLTENERRTIYIDRIVDNSMRELRREIYKTTGGLEEVV